MYGWPQIVSILIVGILNRVRLWIALCESGQVGIVRCYLRDCSPRTKAFSTPCINTKALLWVSANTFGIPPFHFEGYFVGLAKIRELIHPEDFPSR